MEEMPQWIDHFLRATRSNFPMTYLTKIEGEATAVRQSGVNDMARFNPKICGFMDINRTIVNNMIFCRQVRNSGSNYNLFKFQMGISIAHEIVHFLTGYLTGELADRSHTPATVTLQPYGTRRRGEAGHYWESILLGGVAEFYCNKDDPIVPRQAGMPYLFNDGFNTTPARPISMSYIDNFVRGSFTFPIGVSSTGQTTRGALRQRYTEMTHIRWPGRNPPRTTSPPREEPSGSAYRRLPSQYLVGGGSESRSSSYKGYRRPSD